MKIVQNNQMIFDVEIKLTEKALQLLMKNVGVDISERKHYDDLQSKNYDVITSNPSFDLGFGADINDILSLGLMVIAKSNGLDIPFSDLSFHPFRCKFPKFDLCNFEHLDGQVINTPFTPITNAICGETGKEVILNESGFVEGLLACDSDTNSKDDLPF